ncbi:Uncharacterised protein [Comamonas aquatica]|uniref:hypothetical protein n=1 Tax=Comamonas aquatica TaxID=225991 RepID=UPI001EF35888|nr:hypothetical protein [Comamonas aquatica]CAB5646574.1 Uncharacterised protein [Comamonas aquatica]CAC9169704.1 Uncharacterised protein [Comamonas aquatica]
MPYGTTSKYFSSDMPGAPGIFADAGGLVGWLDAVLVNGYGAAVISQIVVTDGVAVVTTNLGHSLRKWMVALNADTGHEGLNGEHRVVDAAGASYTFEVTGVPNGTYTGGSVKVAPLGFEISYSATNRRIYRSKDTARRNEVSLFVDDTNTVSGWNIGTNKALAQVKMVCDVVSIDNYVTLDTTLWHKSAATSGTLARPWILAGDALGFYSAVDVASNGFLIASNHFMQLNTLAAGDQFATMLEGSNPSAAALTSSAGLASNGAGMNMLRTGTRRVARFLAQTGQAVNLRYMGLGVFATSNYSPYAVISSGGGYLTNTTSGFNVVQAAALAPVNAADSGLVLGKDVIACHSPSGFSDGADFTARAIMPGLFSVPAVCAWSMTPALISVRDTVLLPLPAMTCTSTNDSTLTAGHVGGFYVDVAKGWRDG